MLRLNFLVFLLLLTVILTCKGAGSTSSGNVNSNFCFPQELPRREKAAINRANKMITRGDYLHAIKFLDKRLALIGDSYQSVGVEDDTGQKLLLSEIEKRNGALGVSAVLKLGVLSSRLMAYQVAACERRRLSEELR